LRFADLKVASKLNLLVSEEHWYDENGTVWLFVDHLNDSAFFQSHRKFSARVPINCTSNCMIMPSLIFLFHLAIHHFENNTLPFLAETKLTSCYGKVRDMLLWFDQSRRKLYQFCQSIGSFQLIFSKIWAFFRGDYNLLRSWEVL